MKKLITLLIITIFSFCAYSQESAKPSFGVKLERNVDLAVIEGKTYYNVIVELDAASIGDMFKEGVKVTVKDGENPKKKIYKKRFSKSYLYGFSDGTIQVGKGNVLTQLTLFKSKDTGNWLMEIKEKGIY